MLGRVCLEASVGVESVDVCVCVYMFMRFCPRGNENFIPCFVSRHSRKTAISSTTRIEFKPQ